MTSQWVESHSTWLGRPTLKKSQSVWRSKRESRRLVSTPTGSAVWLDRAPALVAWHDTMNSTSLRRHAFGIESEPPCGWLAPLTPCSPGPVARGPGSSAPKLPMAPHRVTARAQDLRLLRLGDCLGTPPA